MFEKIKDKWNDYSKARKIAVCCIPIAIILALIGGFAYWFTDPEHGYSKYSSEKADTAVQKMNDLDIDDDKGLKGNKKGELLSSDKAIYNQVSGIPSLSKLRDLQEQVLNGEKIIIKRGNLSIPYLDIQTPIYEGTNDWSLSFGAGTAKPNQVIGKKNYAVSAHNFAKVLSAQNFFFTHFQRLDIPLPTSFNTDAIRKDAIGHNAYVAGKDTVYTYKIKEAKIVKWTDGYVIDDKMTKLYDNKPILTMTTCYEQSNLPDTQNPPYRIVFVGVQTKKETYKEFKKNHKGTKIFEQPTWLK